MGRLCYSVALVLFSCRMQRKWFSTGQFFGNTPSGSSRRTWQALWRANTELLGAISGYELNAIQRGSSKSDDIYALANATKNWLDQVVRYLETTKKIHNAFFTDHAPRKQKKGDVAAQLTPFWEPLSRCVNKLKHDAAEVCPTHYVSMESGVVAGFYTGVSYGPTTFGAHPHVHPSRGAWSFNRLLPLVAVGIFWANHLVDSAIARATGTLRSCEGHDAI